MTSKPIFKFGNVPRPDTAVYPPDRPRQGKGGVAAGERYTATYPPEDLTALTAGLPAGPEGTVVYPPGQRG